MGRGIAKQAAIRHPGLDRELAGLITRYGNVVLPLSHNLVSFPVKPTQIVLSNIADVVKHRRCSYRIGSVVPGWACVASLDLIKRSYQQLKMLMDHKGWNQVILPFPGVGAGGLSKEEVRPILEEEWDSRIIVVSN
jgi:hypothetical protein